MMLSSIPVSQSLRPPTADHQKPPQTWTAAGVNSDEDDEGCRPFTPPPARERLSYTRYQLELLNGIYENIRYPNSTQKQLIAKRVGITREQVKVWFQNRRRKDVLGSSKCRDFPSLENGLQEAEALQDTRSSCLVPVLVMNSIVTELRKFKDNPYKSKKSSTKLRKSNRLHAAAAAAAPCMVKKSTEDSVYRSAYDIVSPPNQITPTAFSSRMPTQLNHSESSSAFYNPKDTHLDSLAAAAYGRQGKYAEIEAETENRMNPASSQQCYEDFNFWGLAPKMYNTQTSTFGHVPQQMIYGETNRFDITCGGYLDVPYRPTMQFPFRTDQQRWTGKRQFDSHTLYQQHTPHSLPLGESREELSNASLGTNSTDIQISELRFSLPDAANFLSYN